MSKSASFYYLFRCAIVFSNKLFKRNYVFVKFIHMNIYYIALGFFAMKKIVLFDRAN